MSGSRNTDVDSARRSWGTVAVRANLAMPAWWSARPCLATTAAWPIESSPAVEGGDGVGQLGAAARDPHHVARLGRGQTGANHEQVLG